ncbi:putative transmembrane protein [Toxoplasma gondii TgCatPRC2]|uniref:Uncharacterized protein n=5 Tax=Toxoplasma gondii TaxID=5811 RepID=S7UHI7_TOXGG|nr:hypothetical protein TGME49_237880 [Toxoplasma gondii ME49]EPR57170.1 hypothetical protein TGGT1_237880 [Toxoplasma gondii GT1]KAF4645113.1 hypothetical protein TGRH88_009300 [Toxoplasma gondii]KYF38971.1 hypothetical protein TGARI_237880 [Toxoplasma gondii ARI]KYK63184.1 putative transmembrane protein [Toxoplasma gondii TgCatPRC2]EPT31291.1 hypothetical protein TGME49_237880 [Toxoplasma gondii ME49]|eukprot:XP_002372021.1 hypothetical protein TGME49_237880 [Toxoplasma gondii ME49]
MLHHSVCFCSARGFIPAMRKFTIVAVVVFALLGCVSWQESAFVRGAPDQAQAAVSDKESESRVSAEAAAEKLLAMLEQDPVDMTSIMETAKKCCVRRKFEARVYAFVQETLKDLGLNVDPADATDVVLSKLNRSHWRYNGKPGDASQAIYKALEERTADTTYFQ